MKLRIWEDEEGARHTSLDGKEISSILVGLRLVNLPHRPPQVELDVVPSCIEVELEAEVTVAMGDKKYRLKEK